jgi:acylphosphatase
VEGPPSKLAAFESLLREGPPSGSVEGIERIGAESRERFQDFEIRFG